MKNLLCLLIVSTLMLSCNKEVEPTPPPTITSADVFQFDYEGVQYETTDVISAGILINKLSASGIETNEANQYDNMALSIKISSPSVGVFQLGSGSTTSDYVGLTLPSTSSSIPQVSLFSQFSSNPGTVTITELDDVNSRIKGTFSTTVMDGQGGPEFSITNGEFDIPYVQ
jgi:hypothetical protein